MLPGETPWDLDQRLKSTIREANMTLMDVQHRAWFVVSLKSHLRTTLSQQKAFEPGRGIGNCDEVA